MYVAQVKELEKEKTSNKGLRYKLNKETAEVKVEKGRSEYR